MAGAEAAAQEAALLVTAEGARFLDEIRDALADLQLRVVSEERVPLRRPEAAAALQVLQSEAAAPAAADAAAAADGKGKAAKPKKGGKAAAAAPEPEAKSASPRDIDRSDLDALTAGEALVVTVGPALPLDGEDGGPSAAPEGREVWSEESGECTPCLTTRSKFSLANNTDSGETWSMYLTNLADFTSTALLLRHSISMIGNLSQNCIITIVALETAVSMIDGRPKNVTTTHHFIPSPLFFPLALF